MTIVIWNEDCSHAQDVLLNCFGPKDALPYIVMAEKRGTCKCCGGRLGEIDIVIVQGGEEERSCLADPLAIDLSRR